MKEVTIATGYKIWDVNAGSLAVAIKYREITRLNAK